jgi:hypothetical protein
MLDGVATPFEGIETRDGMIVGPLRRSVNRARGVAGSIHDDATAGKLGFRGGTVAGSIHMELMPPLLLRAFGPDWLEQGSLSLYFQNATTDREAVRGFVREPAPGARDAQVEVWIERDDGLRVADGTAALGTPKEPSALHARDLSQREPGALRLLGGLRPGDSLGEHLASVSQADQDARRAAITEPLDWYWSGSPWGRSVLTPGTAVQLLYRGARSSFSEHTGRAVGLFGAIELRHVHGPLRVDEEYRVSARVVAVGQSPKTEYCWFDSAADDASGTRVAEMRMLLRWMKASSPRYQDPDAS